MCRDVSCLGHCPHIRLLRDHQIGLLVRKNSGGPMTAAKLQAARHLSVQVVMVRRPPLPPGTSVVATVPEALRWLNAVGEFQILGLI
jgi:precorrin-6A/cobalt-precorrin-6A reductase